MALFAVTRGTEIGVDVEFIRSGVVDEMAAEKFFSRFEVATLIRSPSCCSREDSLTAGHGKRRKAKVYRCH